MRSIVIAALLLFTLPGTAAETVTGAATVIDGDTLEIHGQRIRLHGIDAPESRQVCTRNDDGAKILCGKEAATRLAVRIKSGPVSCEQKDKDQYGRMVAVCRASDGMNLNAWMVTYGQAMAYRQYSQDYEMFEDGARVGKLGIWATEFTPPWEWRKEQRALAGGLPPTLQREPSISPSTTVDVHSSPNCKKGKPCGNSCIAMDKVCHK